MPDNIQFDTDTRDNRSYGMKDASGQKTSAMAAWLIKHGISKSAASAQNILIAVVVINAIIIFLIIHYFT